MPENLLDGTIYPGLEWSSRDTMTAVMSLELSYTFLLLAVGFGLLLIAIFCTGIIGGLPLHDLIWIGTTNGNAACVSPSNSPKPASTENPIMSDSADIIPGPKYAQRTKVSESATTTTPAKPNVRYGYYVDRVDSNYQVYRSRFISPAQAHKCVDLMINIHPDQIILLNGSTMYCPENLQELNTNIQPLLHCSVESKFAA